MVEISREERDVYLIPQNFVDTGTILGGTVKLRNAVEAAVLAVGSAVPLFYLPLAFNIRLMIVIAVSVPLGVFGVVGIGGDSLTQFAAHWFRFMKRRRIVTPTPQGNLEANRHRHLRFISKRYRVVYYDDSDALPHNAQVLQRKADRHGKLVKRQTLYDLLPIEKIENGILHTTDDRYIKILEIEPINFLLRSPREQRSVIYSFASLLKVSPVRLQFKSFSRKADVNAYLDKLRRDAANEPDAAVRKRLMSYIRFVKHLGSRDAVSRRFFVIFQYEAPTSERNISYAEIVSTLETTARNFRTYLAQCDNAIVEHENEDEFLTDVFYTLLNRRTAVQVPLQERIQDVLASYLAQNDVTALDKIPPAAFMIPPSLDLKHGRYLYMHGMYKLNVGSYALATVARALVAVAGYTGTGDVKMMLLFTAIAALGQGPWQGDMNAVIASCSEYTWLTKHKRVDGTMYSCTLLGVKLGGGLGTAITGWLLAFSNYDKALAVQPESCINMLKLMYLVIPFVLDAIITFILSRMKVEEANDKIRAEMKN